MRSKKIISALLGLFLLGAVLARPLSLEAENGTITVSNTVLGETTSYIGATEGGTFDVADLVDCGVAPRDTDCISTFWIRVGGRNVPRSAVTIRGTGNKTSRSRGLSPQLLFDETLRW